MQIGKLRISEQFRKHLLRILSAMLAVLLIIFCFYHFTRMPESEIQTMLVTEDKIEETVAAEAVIFRKETVVSGANTGLAIPLVASGTHVARDTELVSVYGSGAEHDALYRALTVYIDALNAAEDEGDALADLAELREKIETLSLSVVSSLEHGDANASASLVEELRILYSRVQALTDEEFTLSTLISSLEAQRTELCAAAGTDIETLSSSESGYYYPYADGYAELCAASKIEALTGSEFLSIAETIRTARAPDTVAGTFVPDPEWFLAVPTELSADELASLTIGGTYPVIFTEQADVRVPMTLTKTVEGTGDTPSLLILSTLRIPEGFSFERLQTVHVVTGSIEGFSVPTAAVHTLDGLSGVYVLEGNVMYFCRVEILHDLGARYIVKSTDPTPGGEFTSNTYRYIGRYDAMILSGTKLFHGRVLS